MSVCAASWVKTKIGDLGCVYVCGDGWVLVAVWVWSGSCGTGAKASAEPSSGWEVRAMISIAVLCSHLNGGQKPCEISEQREGERSVEMKQWFIQQWNRSFPLLLTSSPDTHRQKALLVLLSWFVSVAGRAQEGRASDTCVCVKGRRGDVGLRHTHAQIGRPHAQQPHTEHRWEHTH